MLRLIFLAPLFVLTNLGVLSNSAHADAVVSYGVDEGGTLYIDLLPETANQSLQLFATGLDSEAGANRFDLNVQIGDGGAFNNGVDTSPTISSVDLITGTIWESFSPSQTDDEVQPLFRRSRVDTTSLVRDDGLIGTIFFDTTGFGSGEIDFLLTGVGGEFDTTFAIAAIPLPTVAPNGVIRVRGVPEPSTVLVLAGGMIGLGFRRRRKA